MEEGEGKQQVGGKGVSHRGEGPGSAEAVDANSFQGSTKAMNKILCVTASAQPTVAWFPRTCSSPCLVLGVLLPRGMNEAFLLGTAVILWPVRQRSFLQALGSGAVYSWLEWFFFDPFSSWQPLGFSLALVQVMSHLLQMSALGLLKGIHNFLH